VGSRRTTLSELMLCVTAGRALLGRLQVPEPERYGFPETPVRTRSANQTARIETNDRQKNMPVQSSAFPAFVMTSLPFKSETFADN
jgi:hypothetical protein